MSSHPSDDEEERRRRNEINMFAAMALEGDADAAAAGNDDDNSIPAASSTVAGSRRQQHPRGRGSVVEKATADEAVGVATEPKRRRSPREPAGPSSLFRSDFAGVVADGHGDGPGNSSGTFQFSSRSKNAHGEASNLEAAAEALAAGAPGGDDDASNGAARTGPDGTASGSGGQRGDRADNSANDAAPPPVVPDVDAPMFAERVVMDRPLFFGAVIPPRVLREGRQMVRRATEDFRRRAEGGEDDGIPDGNNAKSRQPTLQQMPASVRNLVGALRTFGYGLGDEALFEDDEDNGNTDTDTGAVIKYKGDGRVTTYQSVWNESARESRIQKFKLLHPYRPHHVVARSSTAPPRLMFEGSPDEAMRALIGQSPPFTITTTTDKPMDEDGVEPLASAADAADAAAVSSTATGGNTASTASRLPQSSGQQSGETSSLPGLEAAPTGATVNANEQFSAWLRGAGGADTLSDDAVSQDSISSPPPVEQQLAGTAAVAALQQQPQQKISLSEAEQFAQWARGSTESMQLSLGGGTAFSVSNPGLGKAAGSSGSVMFAGGGDSGNFSQSTFRRVPAASQRANKSSGSAGSDDDGDDDDSVVDNELKKQVGISDHLSKALASFADDGQPPADDLITAEKSKLLLAQTANKKSAKLRPLTNYELTNGCVPLFGVDDAPLPLEADLGVHETKDEQQRSNEQKRSQELIEKFVGPNTFASIACPNPALNPDDFHSWNNRATQRAMTMGPASSSSNQHDPSAQQLSLPQAIPALPRRQGAHATTPSESSAVTTGSRADATTPSSKKATRNSKRNASRSRFGWWNVDETAKRKGKAGGDHSEKETKALLSALPPTEADKDDKAASEPPLQLPPLHHSSSAIQVTTLLEPQPHELHKANQPLSSMHAATSVAQTLPYLSDRPPSYRYLQIDTQAVAFRPIGAELEPLFCSLAVYNVETISSEQQGGGGLDHAPVPDLQRCGRVTEALQFDVISDPDIAQRCGGALWPYEKVDSAMEPKGATSSTRLQGSRCGVFPVPSNLNVSNLYAVLIVRKVLQDESELDPYLKVGYTATDVFKCRSKAEKASGRFGKFLMPFAFGVAPLLQVFGADNPVCSTMMIRLSSSSRTKLSLLEIHLQHRFLVISQSLLRPDGRV